MHLRMSELTRPQKPEGEVERGRVLPVLGFAAPGWKRQHQEFWLNLGRVDIGPKSYMAYAPISATAWTVFSYSQDAMRTLLKRTLRRTRPAGCSLSVP